ncbi:MAG: hypothetical protein IPM30_03995 [Burkholderiales bacterium]|nr:hypothetical protein [Burkholderiales bacterium]
MPLPLFFTAEQQAHALRATGADAVLATAAPSAAPAESLTVAGERLALSRRIAAVVPMPRGTRKVTFTSGSTGQPKGVCLGESDAVGGRRPGRVAGAAGGAAAPLRAAAAAAAGEHRRRLRAAGGRRQGRGAARRAGRAARLVHLQRGGARCRRQEPSQPRAPSCCRRCSVRGAAGVPPSAPRPACAEVRRRRRCACRRIGARQARLGGLPAYEGYGLSEAASVQNAEPAARRPTWLSRRVLPHARVRVDSDGQIRVGGAL